MSFVGGRGGKEGGFRRDMSYIVETSYFVVRFFVLVVSMVEFFRKRVWLFFYFWFGEC